MTVMALLAVMLSLPLIGERCIVIEDAGDGGLAVRGVGIEFLPEGGWSVMPVGAFRGACVLIRTNVTIAGVSYAAGDKLVVDAGGNLTRASRARALRMVVGYWTGRLTRGGPDLTTPRRALD